MKLINNIKMVSKKIISRSLTQDSKTGKIFDYREYLKDKVKIRKTEKTKVLQKIFKTQNDSTLINVYFNEPFDNYQFNQSSLYTAAFRIKLKEALGCPKAFKKANKKNRQAKANKINQLFNLEDKFKTTLRRSIFNNKLLDNTFELEKQIFKELFVEMAAERDPRTNVNKKFFRSKVYRGLGLLIQDLIDERILPDFFKTIYLEIGFESTLILKLTEIHNTLYNDIIKVFLDRAYYNLFNNELEEKLSELNSFLVVKKTDLVYTLVFELIKSFFIIFCTVIQDTNGTTNQKLDLIETSFLNYMTRNSKRLQHKTYYNEFISITYQIVDLFIDSTIQDTIKLKLKGRKHSETFLTLEFKHENSVPFSLHLPELCPPLDWNSEGICPVSNQELVRSLHFGDSEISYDKNTVNAINLTQQKPFTINKKFLNILLETDKKENENIELPFPTFKQMVKQKEKVEKLSKFAFKKSDSEMYKFIMNTEKRLDDYSFNKTKSIIKDTLGLTELDFELNAYYKRELKKLKVMNNKRQIHLTVIFIAEVYSDFTIFYKNFACYRLRWYPWNWIMSRSTGFYKYLLKEAKDRKLTLVGLYSLTQAYYFQNKHLFNKLKTQIDPNNLSKKELILFFKQNPIDNFEKNPLYFQLLHDDLLEISKGKTTSSALIEIDQKTSCAVFMSLLLKNKHLAEFSNLLGGQSVDLNEYLQNNTESYFKEQKYESERILNFFKNNRIAHKKSFMSWCYSQGAMGRADTWVEQFEELYGDLSKTERSVLFKFAHKYPLFLDQFFPNLIKQLEALTNIFDFFLKQTKKTKLKTLDGSIVYWQFYEQIDDFARYYSFIEKRRISIRIAKSVETEMNYKKSHRAFLAGVIHAIDGSFMRLLVLRFNQKHKNIILNPNHDSIQVSPNYVEELYSTILDLYTDDTFINLAEQMLFEPMLTEIPSSSIDEFNTLVGKFNDLKQEFKIEKNKINIKNLYRFE